MWKMKNMIIVENVIRNSLMNLKRFVVEERFLHGDKYNVFLGKLIFPEEDSQGKLDLCKEWR